eukprot:Gb_15171 [translate_table: standard]
MDLSKALLLPLIHHKYLKVILTPSSGRNRRLLSVPNDNHPEFDSQYGSIKDGFPTWFSAGDRRLLQTPQRTIQADAVVAKDGSGNYTTITDAVKSAPDKSDRRYVIHVKGGVYEENVVIKKKKTNLVFIGDGMNATVVTGSKNFVDGTTTFRSATFGKHGEHFLPATSLLLRISYHSKIPPPT